MLYTSLTSTLFVSLVGTAPPTAKIAKFPTPPFTFISPVDLTVPCPVVGVGAGGVAGFGPI